VAPVTVRAPDHSGPGSPALPKATGNLTVTFFDPQDNRSLTQRFLLSPLVLDPHPVGCGERKRGAGGRWREGLGRGEARFTSVEAGDSQQARSASRTHTVRYWAPTPWNRAHPPGTACSQAALQLSSGPAPMLELIAHEGSA
jgi:hypothetical protein